MDELASLTDEQIREEQRELAASARMTIAEAYAALDRGDFHGTILASKLKALRFLLGGRK